jgi:hypothetical protein
MVHAGSFGPFRDLSGEQLCPYLEPQTVEKEKSLFSHGNDSNYHFCRLRREAMKGVLYVEEEVTCHYSHLIDLVDGSKRARFFPLEARECPLLKKAESEQNRKR